MSAPVGHTCPDINAAQKLLEDIVGLAEDEVEDRTVRMMRRDAEQLDGLLEGLREDNDKLRTWGTEQDKAATAAEAQVKELTQQLDDLQNTNEETEAERQRLEVLGEKCAALLMDTSTTRRQRLASIRHLLSQAGFISEAQQGGSRWAQN